MADQRSSSLSLPVVSRWCVCVSLSRFLLIIRTPVVLRAYPEDFIVKNVSGLSGGTRILLASCGNFPFQRTDPPRVMGHLPFRRTDPPGVIRHLSFRRTDPPCVMHGSSLRHAASFLSAHGSLLRHAASFLSAHGSPLRRAASFLSAHGRSRCDSQAQKLQLSGLVAPQLLGS